MLATSHPLSDLPPGLLAVLDRLPAGPPFTRAAVGRAVERARAAGYAPPTADRALASLLAAELVRRAAQLDGADGPAYVVDVMARPL